MSDLSSILSNLQLKEDLFKSVTYITTGDLNEKVIFFLLFFPHNISNTNKKKTHFTFFFGKFDSKLKSFIQSIFIFQISNVLEKGGASHAKYIVLGVTHLVCGENYNENDITEASEVYEIPPVTESWVVASLKLGRLASTKCYNPLLSKLFPNFIFAITNVGPKDKKTLIAIVEFNGGKVLSTFNKTTTHLICGSASGLAYNRALELKLDSLTIATPNWIIDCLKNKSITNSEMYHPRFLIVPQLKMVSKPPVSAEPEKPNASLTSILGFDFEESNKSEITDKKEEEPVKSETKTIQPKPIQNPVTTPTTPTQPQITQKPQNIIQQQPIQHPGQIQVVRGQMMTPQQQQQQIQQIRAQYSQLNPQQQQQFQKQTQQIVATSTMANITGNVNTGGIMITKTNQITTESEIVNPSTTVTNHQSQQQQQNNQSSSSSIEEANQQLRQHLENFASQYQNKAPMPGQQIIVSIKFN